MRRIIVAAVVVLLAAGCGGGGAAAPGTGPGSISGTVSVSVSLARAQAPAGRVGVSPTIRRVPAGAPLAVADEVLVKLRPGAALQAVEIHRQAGAAELKRASKTGISLVRITSGEPLAAVLARYRSDPRVAYAEPNYFRYLAATPNDPFYVDQWHYASVGLPAAWNTTTGSSLVVVAVIDSGILAHEDLAGVTVTGYDFFSNDPNPADPGCPAASDLSHGSHVAGTIAAATNNALGVAGVNWGGPGRTKIMPLRIFGNISGQCTTTSDRIIDAIEYAADHSARVINMSFGGPGFSQMEQDAVTYAYNTGIVLVAAAGNTDPSGADCAGVYPAAYANVIGVAATTLLNAKAPYSNFGTCVDLAAPGGDVTADANGDGFVDGVLSSSGTAASPNQYWFFQGTSMASPHVAGLAALLLSKGVTGPAAIQNLMQSTATDLGAGGYDTTFGGGLINAAAALGAPAATNAVKAFAGTISGTVITLGSAIVTASSTGTYLLPDVVAGPWTVFAWQDTNGSGPLEGGDLYGPTPGVLVSAGTPTTGVNVSVREVPTGTSPITIASVGRPP